MLVSYSEKLLGLLTKLMEHTLVGWLCLLIQSLHDNQSVVTGSESHLLLHILLLHGPYIPDNMETASSSLTPFKHHSMNFQISMKQKVIQIYGHYTTLQKTKDKTYNQDFAVNSVECFDDPNEDVCASGKKDLFQQPTILRCCLLHLQTE